MITIPWGWPLTPNQKRESLRTLSPAELETLHDCGLALEAERTATAASRKTIDWSDCPMARVYGEPGEPKTKATRHAEGNTA